MTSEEKRKLKKEVLEHYEDWNEDNQKRLTRHNGWNEITDAYLGVLPEDWPYMTRIVDPKIRTTLIEKNSRLLNAKLRGRLVPREGGDTIGALLNNAVLDFQWDNANDGGSMMVKVEISDMDTRLYGSKFMYVYWKYELDEEGKIEFDGNEARPLDLRDCGMDPTASHVKDAKWFQMRTWDLLEDLQNATDAEGKPLYNNLEEVKIAIDEKIGNRSSNRTNDYQPRVMQIRGLEDRTGQDLAFPVVKKVIEFRKNKWITFLPEYKKVIRVEDNPYDHKRIPIAQLRYFPLQDDPLGESEVESVLGIWRAIQVAICSYMDEMILKMRPPLKVIENAARVETIIYGAEVQWLVDRQDAIEEMTGNGQAMQYFQTTYQALLSAFNVAMGDLSEQTSAVNSFDSTNKTATEIKASLGQQNSRDQSNQNNLGEYIADIMMMWLGNNKQFLFSNPEKTDYVIRIVGKEKFAKLQEIGLDSTTVMPETMTMIADIIKMHPEMGDAQLASLYEAGKLPTYPIVLNPDEKDPEKIEMKPKMSVNEQGDIADVTLLPEDLDGTYDYVADVKSMSMGASDTLMQARARAIDRLTTNPTVIQLLAQEGYTPKIKGLLVDEFEGTGISDGEQYFEKIQTTGPTSPNGGAQPNSQVGGLPGVPSPNTQGGIPQPMAGSQPVQNAGGVPQAILGATGQGNGVQGAIQPTQ
jgi:hypothetical protein